jgi:hypothetical protein
MKYSDEEVLWLAWKNEGYGLKRFVTKLYNHSVYSIKLTSISSFLKEYGEEVNLNLITHLEKRPRKWYFTWGHIRPRTGMWNKEKSDEIDESDENDM